MIDSPTPRYRSPQRGLLAVVVALALFAVGCGSEASEPASAIGIGNALSENHAGPGYGSTLAEWDAGLAANGPSPQSEPVTASTATTLSWDNLIPPGYSAEDIMDRYQERLDAVEPGTIEATELFREMRDQFDGSAVDERLNGQIVRLAGFVAPLTYENELVTEFLLVPTFGACIHVPPPPPNQIVVVALEPSEGLTVDDTWGPVWVEGTMEVSAATTDLAVAAYNMVSATAGPYQGA